MALVVKVKYQGTLQNLNLQLRGEFILEINMDALRGKIRKLFQLSSNIDMAITYTDEDDGTFTMADDVDFLDNVHQGLNSLFLDVSLGA